METSEDQKKNNTVTLLREKLRNLLSASKSKLDALRIQKIKDEINSLGGK